MSFHGRDVVSFMNTTSAVISGIKYRYATLPWGTQLPKSRPSGQRLHDMLLGQGREGTRVEACLQPDQGGLEGKKQ